MEEKEQGRCSGEKKLSKRGMLQKQQKANEDRALLETEEQLTEKVVDIIEAEIK
jgi:hypothetical protein